MALRDGGKSGGTAQKRVPNIDRVWVIFILSAIFPHFPNRKTLYDIKLIRILSFSSQIYMQNYKSENYLSSLRHSCAHLLAAAVLELWPDAKPTIGPSIDNGFYYDFEFQEPISEEDLHKIEKKMKEIVKKWQNFERIEVNPEEAEKKFKNNQYKRELIHEFAAEGKQLSLYKSGSFTDLCRGGHIENPSKELRHFKLMSIAGAYWRGDEKNKMLTRIYGTAFPSKDELSDHLHMIKEAKKRDHRKLGRELDLFTFADEVGPGLTLWKPKGTIIKDELEKWAKETEKTWGYERVSTPHIAKHTLFEISGHLPYYKDDMYSPMDIDGEDYYLKGMNCPHHHMIYLSQHHSYRDLPIRYAEYGMVYRYEQSGVLFGLMRVRSIEQNDAHIYCTVEQAEEEFLKVLKLHEYYYNTLGLTKDDYFIVIGLPDESKSDKYHGDKKLWDNAERMMRNAIEKSDIKYKEDKGGAAFYGPKIDFNIKSSIGREFSISTNQLDLYMPTRFNLVYTDKDGDKKHCAVIHRAPLGSHERFIGFLIEHFAGAFPLWLSPVQIEIIPVGENHHEFSHKLAQEFKIHDIRVDVDDANETVGNKIRKSVKMKVPYMLVIGDKEMESPYIHVRKRGSKDVTEIPKDVFIKQINKEIKDKVIW